MDIGEITKLIGNNLLDIDINPTPEKINVLFQYAGSTEEAPLQAAYNAIFVEELPSYFKDTHASCTLSGKHGETHKPDITMLVNDCLTWESIDVVLEIKVDIHNNAGNREVCLQIYSRPLEVLDHQPDRRVV